jgi:prepilin-type N-terminal cleavage/methylation domain-containing protein/prepilin-type processing-associated H-X9-DG protein
MTRADHRKDANVRSGGRVAFPLIELLVVVAIIGVLASLVIPALGSARHAGRKAACISNLRQTGISVQLYAMDHEGMIPYGPKAPPFTSPSELYPSTGAPTSLLSLRSGEPAGLGLLLGSYLANTPRVLFCPGADQALNTDDELARVGKTQAQGSYYYRHAGVIELFFTPKTLPSNLLLENLGNNRKGGRIQALVMDTQFQCQEDLATFGVRPRTHHREKLSNVLYADGSCVALNNPDGRMTVDVRSYSALHDTFNLILKIFEYADSPSDP